MNRTSDYRVGDVLRITSSFRGVQRTHEVEVTAVNWNNNGLVTYSGTTGQGAFKPESLGKPQRFGFVVKVERVSRQSPWRPWSPRPGDRSYDPVH